MPSTDPYALVVNDYAVILLHARDILERAGFRCLEAVNGGDALEVMKQHGESVTLLSSDVDLGAGINGFALARHVAERWPETEIVIASGHFSPKSGEMPAKATFIAKPFSERTVIQHLAEKLPDSKKPEPLRQSG